jgi:hypothetical protein
VLVLLKDVVVDDTDAHLLLRLAWLEHQRALAVAEAGENGREGRSMAGN